MPSRRLREPGYSLSWRILLLALILAFPGPTLAMPVGEADVPEELPLHDPFEAWFLGDPAAELGLPRDLAQLLASLDPRGPHPSAESAWDAYFAALGLAPTPDERAALEATLLEHPAMMAALEPVLRDLAHAQVTRDATFARLDPAERAHLVAAAVRLATGDAAGLTPEESAALAQVDLARLKSAAAALARDAGTLEATLDGALAADARVGNALPAGLAQAIAARDALATLAAIADAEPARSDVPWSVLAASLGAPDSAQHLPPDLAAPLADIVSTALAARATPDPQDDRVALATIAAATPALARASYNLTLRAPGDLDALAGAKRPADFLTSTRHAHASLALADVLGPGGDAQPAPLTRAHADLRAALGLPADPALAARVADLETRLGPDLAGAIGGVLAAQARYHSALSPDSPGPARAREAAAAAAPLLASNAALSQADLATLADAASAQVALRELTGFHAGAILDALADLQSLNARSPVPLTGRVHRDDTLVIYGTDDNHITPDDVPQPPVLFLDLGGDDTYTAPVGGVDLGAATPGFPLGSDATRTSVAIDLDGDDRYTAKRAFTLGAAKGAPFAPAMGVLLDAGGNDTYDGGNLTLGMGVDGFGILIDAAGDDAYAVEVGLAVADASGDGGMAAGVLVDLKGADKYRAREGYARLRNTSSSPIAVAAFVDVGGPDVYEAVCQKDMPCFATPRREEPVPTPGVILFVEGGGADAWPRGFEPGNVTTSGPAPVNPFSPFARQRYVFVATYAYPQSDSDGDLLPDEVEGQERARNLGFDPQNATLPDPALTDTDGDGWSDYLEKALRTNPADPNDAPASVPRPPAPVPDAYQFLPNGGNGTLGRPGSSNFLVNLPGVLAIGLPGTTVYRHAYNLSIDLGIEGAGDASALDLYFGSTASDAIAIDLGGNDKYAPQPTESGAPQHLARSTRVPALLLDLGGNDEYVAERDGIARSSLLSLPVSQDAQGNVGVFANGPGLAILIDAAGGDTYISPRGTSQAYASTNSTAYLVDLQGDDRYSALTQGAATGEFAAAFFVDAGGRDTYTRPLAPEAGVEHQGTVVDGNSIGVETVAAFYDLGGLDAYRYFNGRTNVELPDRNNRLRVRPIDDPRGGAVAVFLDTSLLRGTTVENSDSDNHGDAEETVAGTSSSDAEEGPTDGGFVLNLPRLGIGIGADGETLYKHDYALILDRGGTDTYRNRPGASSPRFPVAIAIDNGESDDEYDAQGARNLSTFLPYSQTTGTATVWNEPNRTAAQTNAAAALAQPQVGETLDAALGAAHGAGVFGVGILLDDGGANKFRLQVESVTCLDCLQRALTLGVAQGAGLVGVGILDIREGQTVLASDFSVTVRAVHPDDFPVRNAAIARGLAQGAGVLGVGILANGRAATGDRYEIRALTVGPTQANASAGQGFAMRGLGVLLDEGGNNEFLAGGLAQAAADDDNDTLPLSTVFGSGESGGQLVYRARPTLAMLLLPGVGNDVLTATERSQAYSGAAGVAVLYDAEGNDLRSISGYDGRAMGQAAANMTGTAFLIDDRGDDRYVSSGNETQAFGFSGVAVLQDLSGNDHYQSTNVTQGVVRVQEHATAPATPNGAKHTAPPAAALFVDRMGFDTYVITPGAVAQGATDGIVRIPGATAPLPPAAGTALFVDGGGSDDYQARAANWGLRRVVDTRSTTLRWDTTAAPYYGGGVDTNDLSTQFAALAGRLYDVAGTGAGLTVHKDETGSPAWPAGMDLQGSVTLRGSLVVNKGEGPQQVAGALDRAEFLYEGRPLGPGKSIGGGRFELDWDTAARDGPRPRYPDGTHTLTALLYPRAGTPAGQDPAGRRAAVDVEPFPAYKQVELDNPPLAHLPAFPAKLPGLAERNVSIALTPVPLRLWVDRDLESGACPYCAAMPAHLGPAGDAWDVPTQPAPGALARDPCLAAACAPTVGVAGAADGRAYVTWTAPTQAASLVVGYVVVRTVDGESTSLAYLDARAPLRYRDPSPVADASYSVVAVRSRLGSATGAPSAAIPYAPSSAPGPVLGLRAAGAEGGVRLAWTALGGVTAYAVERAGPDGAWSEVEQVSGTTTSFDGSAQADVPYSYRVVPYRDGVRSLVPGVPVSAMASPGPRVTLRLDGATTSVTILDNASLGGGQEHVLPWDAAGVPEGRYDLRAFVTDATHPLVAAGPVEVVLDRRAPDAEILLPGVVGASYLGGGGVRIPIRVTDGASGPAFVAAAARVGTGPWLDLGSAPLSAITLQEDGSHLVNLVLAGVADGQRAEIVAVAMDGAGNVMGVAPRPWPATLAEGIEAAKATGGVLVTFDFVPPVVAGMSVKPFVKPGERVHLEATAGDAGTGLSAVNARVGTRVIPLRDAGAGRFVGEWLAEVGAHQVAYEAIDGAGNLAADRANLLVVDAAPPLVDEARIVFSGGRLVGTPGETARVTVRARDLESPTDTLNVTLDASNVSSRATVKLAWSRNEQTFGADLLVDRVAPVTERNVTLYVTDRAGNVANVTVPVVIDAVPIGFATPVSIEARADRAWLNWTSVEDARARVDHGLGPQLGARTELGPSSKNHSILLTGLTPATRHYVKAVLVTDAGIETASLLLDFTTAPGLVVSLAPLDGFPYGNGKGALALDVRTFTGDPATASAEVFLLPPRGSPTVVADAPRPGKVDLQLAGFRDGTYSVVARAKTDKLTGQSAPMTVVIDRVAPIVDLQTEAVIVPGQELQLTALERGSGIDLDKLSITVDNRTCVARLVADTLSCTAPRVDKSVVDLKVLVADRAGNQGVFETRLPAALPQSALLREARLVGETGHDAIRPGSQATLLVEADAIGIERVVADLRSLGGPEERVVPYVGHGRYELSFDVPASIKSGPVVVPVKATDRADRARHLIASAFLDDTPPRADVLDVVNGDAPGKLVVRVFATEPVRLRVDAPGAHAERAEHRAETQATLTGLRPGRTLQLLVTLTDRAGNVATLTAEATTPRDALAPRNVETLEAFDLGDGRIVLTWDPASDDVGIDGYRVYRKEGATLTLLATVTERRYEADAPPGVDVEFVVSAVDLGGNEGDGTSLKTRSSAVPHLSGGRVEPPLGGPGLYEFRVNVTQKAGPAPAVEVIVDGRPVRMTTDAASCETGCSYRALVTLGPQPLEGDGHQFAFVAHHDGLSVRLPESGDAIDGPIVVGNVKSSVLQGASRVPLTPVLGLVGVLVAAAGIVAWRALRRKGN